MTDIFCLLCGNANPEGLGFCQFCQADLAQQEEKAEGLPSSSSQNIEEDPLGRLGDAPVEDDEPNHPPQVFHGNTNNQNGEGQKGNQPSLDPENDLLKWVDPLSPGPSLQSPARFEQVADWLSGAPVVHPLEDDLQLGFDSPSQINQGEVPNKDVDNSANLLLRKIDEKEDLAPSADDPSLLQAYPDPEIQSEYIGSISFESQQPDWLDQRSGEQADVPDGLSDGLSDGQEGELPDDLKNVKVEGMAGGEDAPQFVEPKILSRPLNGETRSDPFPDPPFEANNPPPTIPAGTSPFHPSAEEGLSPHFAPSAKEEAPVFARSGDDEDLAQNQFPDWLQATQPLNEANSRGDAKGEVPIELAGPLAGLSAVLPPGDLASYYSKPPVYSTGLIVTEKQRLHSAILENSLQEHPQTSDTPSVKRDWPERLIKIAIGSILMLVMTFAIFFGGQTGITSLPPGDGQAATFFNQLEAIPDGVPALIAVDYQPGYHGEMSLNAINVLARLFEKKSGMALISTNPSGPALGIDLLAATAGTQNAIGSKGGDASVLKQKTVNLGFLSGGTAALQEFAANPEMATYYGQDVLIYKRPAWEHPVLKNVTELQDFGMVIVVCDTFDSGKAWIEQVQPNIGKSPMFIVTSAQAGPLFAPYLASGQVRAMLAGFIDGATYSQLANLPPTPDGGWLAYQAGTILILALILLGFLIQGFSLLFQKKTKQNEVNHGG